MTGSLRATKYCCYSRIWIIFLGVPSNTALDRMWRTSWLHNLRLVLICIFSQNFILKIFRDICKKCIRSRILEWSSCFWPFCSKVALFAYLGLSHLYTCLWSQKNPQKAKKSSSAFNQLTTTCVTLAYFMENLPKISVSRRQDLLDPRSLDLRSELVQYWEREMELTWKHFF